MSVELQTRMRIVMPRLDFTKTISEVAQSVILPDIRLGINRGVGIDNRPFPQLEESTIARKKGVRKNVTKNSTLKAAGLAGARGGTQTLVDTGKLRDSSMGYRVVRQNHVRISVGGDREKVAYYLQKEGVGKKKKTFHFFGISQRAEFQGISKMNQAIKEALRAVNGR